MRLQVTVKSQAKKNSVQQLSPTSFQVSTTASPIDNQANLAVIKLLAQHLHLKKSQIHLRQGAKSKSKVFEIIP